MKFKSKYKSLMVYIEDSPISFKNGIYETEDKKEISVLKKISDITIEKNEKPIGKDSE